MGVLDDAIREHLELKRQHGASQGEIEQQEQEALGPPGRQPAAPAEADAAVPEEPAAEAEPVAEEPEVEVPVEPEASEPEPEPAVAEEPEPESREPASVSVVDVPPLEPDDEPELAEAVDDEPDWDYEPAEEPAIDEPADEEQPRRGDTPPRGFERVEDVHDDGDEEDVLEETPDFLQETPEHDRLWFEQKPPRDFDFDDDKK
jgi:hypothetical protein